MKIFNSKYTWKRSSRASVFSNANQIVAHAKTERKVICWCKLQVTYERTIESKSCKIQYQTVFVIVELLSIRDLGNPFLIPPNSLTHCRALTTVDRNVSAAPKSIRNNPHKHYSFRFMAFTWLHDYSVCAPFVRLFAICSRVHVYHRRFKDVHQGVSCIELRAIMRFADANVNSYAQRIKSGTIMYRRHIHSSCICLHLQFRICMMDLVY